MDELDDAPPVPLHLPGRFLLSPSLTLARTGRPPRVTTDFRTVAFLGAGAFGCVYKVMNTTDGRHYTLKILQLAGDAPRRAKVMREARLLSSLSHERITRYFNCWVEELAVVPIQGDARDGPPRVALRVKHYAAAQDAAGEPRRAHANAHGLAGAHGDAADTGASVESIGLRSDSVFMDGATRARRDSDPLRTHMHAHTHGHAHRHGPPLEPSQPAHLCAICCKRYRDWYVSFTDWTRLDTGLQPLHLCVECYRCALGRLGMDTARVVFTHKDGTPIAEGDAQEEQGWEMRTYLFIQTEFCARTLMEELSGVYMAADMDAPTDARSEAEAMRARYVLPHDVTSRVWTLFWQIVEGLAYLHANNIVHRDLKPSNIFASGPLGTAHIKIGDLGLATTQSAQRRRASTVTEHSLDDTELPAEDDARKRAAGANDADVADARMHGHYAPRGGAEPTEGDGNGDALVGAPMQYAGAKHNRAHASRGVGTYFYMAPEAHDGRYTDRSDMYSLGVCLYEMWARFESAHERARMLEALKAGSVPRAFIDAAPVQSQLISNLLQADASKRPSSADLLRYRFFLWSPALLPGGTSATGSPRRPASSIEDAGTTASPSMAAQAAAFAYPMVAPGPPTVVVDGEGIMPSPSLPPAGADAPTLAGLRIGVPVAGTDDAALTEERLPWHPTLGPRTASQTSGSTHEDAIESAPREQLVAALRAAWSIIQEQADTIRMLQGSPA